MVHAAPQFHQALATAWDHVDTWANESDDGWNCDGPPQAQHGGGDARSEGSLNDAAVEHEADVESPVEEDASDMEDQEADYGVEDEPSLSPGKRRSARGRNSEQPCSSCAGRY